MAFPPQAAFSASDFLPDPEGVAALRARLKSEPFHTTRTAHLPRAPALVNADARFATTIAIAAEELAAEEA